MPRDEIFEFNKMKAAMSAKRCQICQSRVKLYRETKYLNPVWRCEGCGRTTEVEQAPVNIPLEPREPVSIAKFASGLQLEDEDV